MYKPFTAWLPSSCRRAPIDALKRGCAAFVDVAPQRLRSMRRVITHVSRWGELIEEAHEGVQADAR